MKIKKEFSKVSMRVIFLKISIMVMDGNGGKMGLYMRDSLSKIKNTVKVNLSGLMVIAMKVTSSKITLKVTENIVGATEDATKASSKMN